MASKNNLVLKYDFIDNEDFDKDGILTYLLNYKLNFNFPKAKENWYRAIWFDIGGSIKSEKDILLTKEEEIIMFKRLNMIKKELNAIEDEGLKEKLKEAREILLYANIGLIFYCLNSKKILSSDKNNREDFVSEGLMCLSDCIEKFDVSKNLKFSNYACSSILRRMFRFERLRLKDKNHINMNSLPDISISKLMEDKNYMNKFSYNDNIDEKIDLNEKCNRLYEVLENDCLELTNNERHFIDFCLFGQNSKLEFYRKRKITKGQGETVERSVFRKLREALA